MARAMLWQETEECRMPTNEEVLEPSYPFLSLDGNEFTAGIAGLSGNVPRVLRQTQIVGKDYEDAADELRTFISGPKALVEIPAAVTILDAEGPPDTRELAAKLGRAAGLSPENLLIAHFDKTTGAHVSVGRPNTLAVGINKTLVLANKAKADALGASEALLTIRALNAIGAVKNALAARVVDGPVLCVCMLASSCLYFLVSANNVEDLGPAEGGHSEILMQIMGELGLKFKGSAARLFFGDVYDFADKGELLAAGLGARIHTKIETCKGNKPSSFFISGIPPVRAALLSRSIADTVRLPYLNAGTLIEAEGLAATQTTTTPEIAHFLASHAKAADASAFFLDCAKDPAHATESAEENHPPHGFVRLYRGTAIDEHGNPVAKHARRDPLPAQTQPRKLVRMYRGTAVYEDE
jgi:hypothetical protein